MSSALPAVLKSKLEPHPYRQALQFWVGGLIVTSAGYAFYTTVLPLARFIQLGAPFHDWQWYLALIVGVIGWPTYVSLRLLFRARDFWQWDGKWAGLALIGLLVWSGTGYNGWGVTLQLTTRNAAPLPISFWAYHFADFSETLLADLAQTKGYLYLPLPEKLDAQNRPAFVNAVHRLARFNLAIYFLPALPDFLSAPTAALWRERVLAAAEFIEQEQLNNVRGLAGDVEHPMQVWPTTPDELLTTQRVIQELLTTMHMQHPQLQTGVTALGMHYLDALDGDTDESSYLRSTVVPVEAWGFINQMTYTSYLPTAERAYYLYLAERALRSAYPRQQVSYLIGLVGQGMPGEPLLTYDELVFDARLSRAIGAPEVAVFQLDGALTVFGQDFVQRLTSAVNATEAELVVPFSRRSSFLIYGALLLDTLLDLQRSPTQIALLLWGGLSLIIAQQFNRKFTLQPS